MTGEIQGGVEMNGVPKLDKRDAKTLLQEVKKLANNYTPEWNFDERSSDFGAVLSKVFCHLMEGTINRYNKTSYNYYLTFLNMLGIKLKPASAASGMVIVKANEGSGGAYIEKGSSLYAKLKKQSDIVVYETQNSLFAVDTKITGIFFTDGHLDTISNVYNAKNETDDDEEEIPPFRIFDGISYENRQNHEIYFGDDIIFDVNKPDLTFVFKNSISGIKDKFLINIFSDRENVSWECYNGSKWEKAKKIEVLDGSIRILFDNKPAVVRVMDKKSRYVRCSLKAIPEGDIYVTDIKYKSVSHNVLPDYLFCNDTHLDDADFFPFEEKYTMYNNFFIACEEVFTKIGAEIEISAEVQFAKIKVETDPNLMRKRFKYVMTDIDFADLEPSDMKIGSVVWEYWNGLGWSHLKVDDEGKEFFNITQENKIVRKVSFKCPEDISKTTVGSGEGHFIRVRISKVDNDVEMFLNYISPYIHKISASYKYPDSGHICKEVIVSSNMDKHRIDLLNSGEVKILDKILCENPAMYICLKNPFAEGTIRLFVNIEEGVHRYNPPIKWEYCADDHMGGYKWKHMDVMDLTEGFSHSETVTMIGRKDFKKVKLFGKEGYFFRIVNPDNKYSGNLDIESRPVIKSIDFNAVRVVQRDTHMPEYFSITKNEEDKLCKLTRNNASDVMVWVNEIGKITVNEQEFFLNASSDIAQPEYDELGNLKKLWIKWKPVPNLICADMLDRVYEIDYSKGEVLFGDGKNGKIPPDQNSESIRIDYSVCNGSKGNVDIGEVKGFISNIDNIMSVTNPSPIMGGVDMETVDNAASRTFSHISGGNRLVSLSDFEDSISFNDRNIYKVKCLSHIDANSKQCIGVTSIAVLPVNYMQGYEKFQGIKNRIWEFIDEKAPVTLSRSSKIRIFEVGYIEISVGLDIVINDFNSYQGVYKGIRTRLEEFLNPVNGNFSRRGWDIGKLPRKEFIYNYIKIVKNIRWIKKINIFTKMITPKGKKEVDFEEVKNNRFVVPVFGEPEINISVN